MHLSRQEPIVPQSQPFDAVLLLAFGGPTGMDEVRPFLDNITRGRSVPLARLDEVARHYALFGGISPLPAIVQRQAQGLTERLAQLGIGLPVHIGMRYWRPSIADALANIAMAGGRRVIGFIAAAHHSHASCGQYKEAVLAARQALIEAGQPDVEVIYVESWYSHEKFIQAWANHVQHALNRLRPEWRKAARLVFTAHSIPVSAANVCKYQEQLTETSRLVAEALGYKHWALVYQSRSGRPTDPWLEPDICDYLRAEHAKGLPAVVLVPIGFLCDHVEVLYDLDHEAAAVCKELNLPMARTETVNDDPIFLDMMADVVRHTYTQHRNGHPLPICPHGTQ